MRPNSLNFLSASRTPDLLLRKSDVWQWQQAQVTAVPTTAYSPSLAKGPGSLSRQEALDRNCSAPAHAMGREGDLWHHPPPQPKQHTHTSKSLVESQDFCLPSPGCNKMLIPTPSRVVS